MALIKGHKNGGAPKGNKNAVRATRFRNALNEALEEFESMELGVAKGQALKSIAMGCVKDALSTDPDVRLAARVELVNRLDGKPKETIDATFTHALASELTDDELLDIARGSSERAADAPAGETDASAVH